MNKRILGLALPNIVTNITVPLLGMVDMAIVGHLSGDHIGAIAIGTQIFNLIYWNFGFLRMGTSGFTAQAFGAERWDEAVKILIRACTIALSIALLIIALQWPISLVVPYIFESSSHVMGLALTYFFVRIWAAPATLGLYAIKGWFIGMQDSKTPMWIAIALNCVNILLSLLFVLVLKWDIFGVALGTVLANYTGLLLGIFLRTLCLSGVFTFITAASSHISDQILAVDALLLQFFTLFSYIMDGFAYAGESLVGRHIGAKQQRHLKLAVRLLIMWGMALTVVFTGLYAAFGNQFLHIFTDQQEVIAAAGKYMYWVLVIPICGFAAFLFDGIFIGATATRTMRNAMFVATAAFFAIYYGLKYYGLNCIGHLTDHGWNNNLWTAFMVFLILRGLLQAIRVRKDIYSQAQ